VFSCSIQIAQNKIKIQLKAYILVGVKKHNFQLMGKFRHYFSDTILVSLTIKVLCLLNKFVTRQRGISYYIQNNMHCSNEHPLETTYVR